MKTFDREQSKKAQDAYCTTNKSPHFAPFSGLCYHCGNDIYSEIDRGTYKTGISVERATNELITGCPHCHHSYCD